MFGAFNPWMDQERHRGWLNQHAENSSRLAQSYAVFDTTGWGEVAFDQCFLFDLTFIEPPVIAYGFGVGLVGGAEMNNDQLVDTRFPRCSGGVYRYKTDKRGFYLGAYCFVTVDTKSPFIPTAMPEPNYQISHWFTFTGIALKDLPADLLNE